MKVRIKLGNEPIGYELETGEVLIGFPDPFLPDPFEEGEWYE